MGIRHEKGKFYDDNGAEVTKITADMLSDGELSLADLANDHSKYVSGKRVADERGKLEKEHQSALEQLKGSYESQLKGTLPAKQRAELEDRLEYTNQQLEQLRPIEDKAAALSNENKTLRSRLENIESHNKELSSWKFQRSVQDDISSAFQHDNVNFKPMLDRNGQPSDFYKEMMNNAKELPVLDVNGEPTGRTRLVYEVDALVEKDDGNKVIERKEMPATQAVVHLAELNRHWVQGSGVSGTGDQSSFNQPVNSTKASLDQIDTMSMAEYRQARAAGKIG